MLELLKNHRTIALIGMAKNVGKTTTLNFLLRAFRRAARASEGAAANGVSAPFTPGLTSIGRDGEGTDAATHTPKPEIYVARGTVIATAEQLLPLCDISKEIIDVSDINTPLGRVILVRALSDGYVQIGGASITAQVKTLLRQMLSLPNTPCTQVLVDGAISRKSPAAPGVTEAAILCTGASLSRSMEKTIALTRHAVAMLTLPAFTPGENNQFFEGALTDTHAATALAAAPKGTCLIAQDASKIFLTPAMVERLRIRHISLAVRAPIYLAALTVNPTAPHHPGYDAAAFLSRMGDAVQIPVFNIYEEGGPCFN